LLRRKQKKGGAETRAIKKVDPSTTRETLRLSRPKGKRGFIRGKYAVATWGELCCGVGKEKKRGPNPY